MASVLSCMLFNLRKLMQNLNGPYNEDLKLCDKKATKYIYKIDLYSEIIHHYPWQQLHVTATKEKMPLHLILRAATSAILGYVQATWYVLGFFKISADINTLSVRSLKKPVWNKDEMRCGWNIGKGNFSRKISRASKTENSHLRLKKTPARPII